MPSFGRSWLEQWGLDPEVVYLNHGTVGAPPKRVLRVQQAIRDEIERQPAQFLLRDLADALGAPATGRGRLRVAAGRVAEFLGARADDLTFVDNATTGANAVLQSVELRADTVQSIGSLRRKRSVGAHSFRCEFVKRDRAEH